MADRAPTLSRFAAWLRALATRRLGLKLASLAVAMLLWMVVRSREQAEGYMELPVRTNLDSTIAPLADAPLVRVFVAGRGGDLMKLYVAPPEVRRTVRGTPRDSVVLDLTPADVHVPAELGEVVRVVDVQPRRVTLRMAAHGARVQ